MSMDAEPKPDQPKDKPSGQPREKTVREINRQISQQLKAEKQLEREKRVARGSGLGALERAEKKHKGNPMAQLAMFFKEYVIVAGTGRKRNVSQRTLDVYGEHLFRALRELKEMGRGVQNLRELGKSHALALIKHWHEEGQKPPTIQGKISTLRRFLGFIGKDKTIPKAEELKRWLEENQIEARVKRDYIPTESKAWDQKGVDLFSVLEQLRAHCAITAMQVEMQAAFGLRMKESTHINPKAADYGNLLRVVHGTKGGLPRDIAFDADESIAVWQRDVLERAKLYAAQNKKGTLSIDGKNVQKTKDHFYYMLKKAGVTKSQLGVTAHGLRHAYAARLYKQHTGMDAPVSSMSGTKITDDTYAADLDARGEISKALGHFRPDISRSYLGSLPALDKNRKKNVDQWVRMTEKNEEFVEAMIDAGVVEVWLGGKAAAGIELGLGENLRLIVRTAEKIPMDQNVEFMLKQRLSALYQYKIDLSQHFGSGSPEDTLELYLNKK
ncbi:XerD Site-specific recombinase XerD [Comamonadaceae bacterium]